MKSIIHDTWVRLAANPWGRIFIVSMTAALLVSASTAWGQVRPIQGGNALDANPMAGSAGYNAVRPSTSGINGNLIVSGNVSSGRSFRGFSPIQNPNTMMTTIPSADLGNFVRDSVGLPSIDFGLNNYNPRPYFNPANTTVSAGIVQNQALLPRQVTGTFSVNQYQGQMPVSLLTGTISPNQLLPELPYAAPSWQPSGTGMFRPDIVMGAGNPLTPYSLSSPVEVSGLQSTTRAGTGGTDTGNTALPPEAPLTQIIRPELTEQPHAGPLALQPSTSGGTPAANLALLPGAAGTTARESSQNKATLPGQITPARAAGQPFTGAETDSTLLTAMQRYAKAVQEAVNPTITSKFETPLEVASKTPEGELLLMPSNMTEDQRQRTRIDIERRQAAQMVEARLRGPIRTLAGAKTTPVDRLLAKAEGLMQQEKYYQASQAYSGIIATNPDNPLAWLGRANALLAAGDYVSAYLALEQGVQRFPQMLLFNFDLPALVGNREVLDVRRAEIEQTLAGKPNYRLQFLLGYLEYFSGLKDLGLRTLKQAADASPAGGVVPEAYQTLARQRGPASQPAK